MIFHLNITSYNFVFLYNVTIFSKWAPESVIALKYKPWKINRSTKWNFWRFTQWFIHLILHFSVIIYSFVIFYNGSPVLRIYLGLFLHFSLIIYSFVIFYNDSPVFRIYLGLFSYLLYIFKLVYLAAGFGIGIVARSADVSTAKRGRRYRVKCRVQLFPSGIVARQRGNLAGVERFWNQTPKILFILRIVRLILGRLRRDRCCSD